MSEDSRFDLTADELLLWREHGYSVKKLVQTIMRLRHEKRALGLTMLPPPRRSPSIVTDARARETRIHDL